MILSFSWLETVPSTDKQLVQPCEIPTQFGLLLTVQCESKQNPIRKFFQHIKEIYHKS